MDVPKHAKLSNKLCRSLPFSDAGQYVVRDSELSGFMVVVGRKTRTYTLQIDVVVLGRRKTIKRKIGDVLDFDASAARQEAQRLTVEIRAEKAKHLGRRTALTFRQAWADYRKRLEARIATGQRSPRTLESYEDCVERLLANWLDVPLREIGENHEMVAERHGEITERHGGYQANRAMTTLRSIYNHALKKRLDRGIPPHNPVSAIDLNPEERRSTGMGPDELRAWGKQLRKLPNAVRQEFHLFCLLSATRPDSLKRARWEHLSVKKRILHFPDPKGGKRRAFDLPLSPAMLRSLWRARRAGRVLHSREARDWIFPAATPTGHISEHKEKRSVLSHWGGDLRQTWRTAAQRAGLSESVHKVHAGLQSFRIMRRMEARRTKVNAVRVRFSKSLASLRQRLSQANVLSTIQRLGRTSNPSARSERLTISTLS